VTVCITSYEYTSVILEENFDLFCFILEKAYSHVCVLSDANLHNSED